ncbi:hypothetical protein OS493_013054 [Desmophyllum pertusum]|uniref:Uncharacterized protein n=1 Tax=Desmophyllum pertusum TaxID=174260 RepID=A0A9W9Z339_9CNID|nr:hypothetical protein OS493_013054 [Desmophyllum pertusum]
MATEKWGPKFPKFNSPQMKAELNEFSAKITPVCGIPEVGFNEEGIAKDVQDFCNEQRRYDKFEKLLKDAASTSSESGESLSTLSVDSETHSVDSGSESEAMIKDSGTPKEDKCSSDY